MNSCADAALRVAVIGDCPLWRCGVTQLIDTAPDLQIVAAVASPQGVGHGVHGGVAVLDLQQPPSKLAAIVAGLCKRGYGVVVASSSPHSGAASVLRAGAGGYLSREAEGDELLTAIRAVGSGRGYLSAPVGVLLEQVPRLTDREREILGLLAEGATDHEIARRLRISKHTVQSHLDRVGEKTGSRRRSELTRLAIEYGLTDGSWSG